MERRQGLERMPAVIAPVEADQHLRSKSGFHVQLEAVVEEVFIFVKQMGKRPLVLDRQPIIIGIIQAHLVELSGIRIAYYMLAPGSPFRNKSVIPGLILQELGRRSVIHGSLMP
jgi:hypothetical protein